MPPDKSHTAWPELLLFALFIIILIIQFRKPLLVLLHWLWTRTRKGIIKCVSWLSTSLQRLERYLSKFGSTSGDDLYEELTPLENADQDKVYDQQLKWALNKENIKNIAITGPYGSGKSSVIKTFQKNHCEYKYLNISLASFPVAIPESKPGNTGDILGTNKTTEFDDAQIELSILQQIILHTHHSRLPSSRFHRIRHRKRWKTFVQAIGLSAFLLTGAYLFNREFFDKFVGSLVWNDKIWIRNVMPWLFLAGCVGFIYILLCIYANSMISKVKLPSAEVEVAFKDSSVLNRQIEEILYFFEATKYDVVVLEDLDRFNNPRIFTKLREINMLINNSEQVQHNVVFLYVLADHVFKGENRTKFFDYIIPVIPVVNTANAYQLLTDRLQKANLTESIPDQFVDEVSLYINDMRLLKNIMNEFNLYYYKLKKGRVNSIDDIKLFSLVIYKNIYPEDFALLQTGKGIIVDEFRRKNEYIPKLTEKMRQKSADLKKKVTIAQDMMQHSIKDLRILYLSEWLNIENPGALSFKIDDNIYSVNQLTDDDLFASVVSRKPTSYNYAGVGGAISRSHHFQHDFKTVENKIDSTTTYQEKEDVLRAKLNGDIEKWKKELEEVNREINRATEMSLKEMLAQLSNDMLSSAFQESKILLFFLRNGYINEEYPYYISHFYPGSLLVEEHDFILAVKERKQKPFTYPLTNMPSVIKRLYLNDFHEPAILNNYLLDYLLKNPADNVQRLEALGQQLSNNKKQMGDFIDQFILANLSTSEFIAFLSRYWIGWWEYVLTHPTMSEETRRDYFKKIIQYADIPEIKAMNKGEIVSSWLSELRHLDISDDKLIRLLSELPVKIKSVIDENAVSDELAEHIYQNNLYEINIDMLKILLEKKAPHTKAPLLLKNQPYTAIKDSDLPIMVDYILSSSNINIFTDKVVLSEEVTLEEPDEVIEQITNQPEISFHLREDVLKKMTSRIKGIEKFDPNFWTLLYTLNKVEPTWSDLGLYILRQNAIDQPIADYMNSFENGNRLMDSFDKEMQHFIVVAEYVLNSNLIAANFYDAVASALQQMLSKVNIESLEVDRIKVLIEYALIPFDVVHFNKLKEKSLKLALSYVVRNRHQFRTSLKELDLDIQDYTELLSSDKLSNDHREIILALIPTEFFEHSELAEVAAKSILEGANVQFAQRLVIIQHNKISELNVRLAIHQLKTEPLVISQVLSIMEKNYAALLQGGKKLAYPNDAVHNELLSLLGNSGYIKEIEVEEDLLIVRTPDIKITLANMKGTWKNEWGDDGSHEIFTLDEAGHYAIDNVHIFDIVELNFDPNTNQVTFFKNAVREGDNRKVLNTLQFKGSDLLEGTEENYKIKYSRISK